MVFFSTFEVMGKERTKEKQNTTPAPNFHAPEKWTVTKLYLNNFRLLVLKFLKLSLNFMKHKNVIVGKFGLH